MHSVSPHLTYSTPHRLCHRPGRASMYESKGYCGCGIYLCLVHLSKYEVIILERHLVTRSELLVGRNQTSSLVKSSASSSVLVRVYWLDDKGSPLCSSVMIRVYRLDDECNVVTRDRLTEPRSSRLDAE